jgi:hypothetical protein
VLEYPQSGERIRGRRKIKSSRAAQPNRKRFTIRRVIGAGDLWVTEYGTFGRVEIAVPRARLDSPEGKTAEWRSTALRAYQRRTRQADALIAGAYLAGTNTRRVRRALAAVFGGAVGKDTVSRVWRKVKSDWDAWNTRSLAEEPIVRLILDDVYAQHENASPLKEVDSNYPGLIGPGGVRLPAQ